MSENQPKVTQENQDFEPVEEKLRANDFKTLLESFGIRGATPSERVAALKEMDLNTMAYLISDLNRKLQGSSSALISENTMKVGERPTVPVENRYDVFAYLKDKIADADPDINPGRIADALSLGIVMLHPFSDGNGRTSRVLRLAFDESFDTDEYEKNFNFLAESRDISRARGGLIAVGYVPDLNAKSNLEGQELKEEQKQDNPEHVKNYFDRLLKEENPSLYVGPAGYSELRVNDGTHP